MREYSKHSCSLNHMPLARPLRRGLQLNLRPKLVAEKAFGGLPARNRTAMVGDLKSEIDSKGLPYILSSVSLQIPGKEMLGPLQKPSKNQPGVVEVGRVQRRIELARTC